MGGRAKYQLWKKGATNIAGFLKKRTEDPPASMLLFKLSLKLNIKHVTWWIWFPETKIKDYLLMNILINCKNDCLELFDNITNKCLKNFFCSTHWISTSSSLDLMIKISLKRILSGTFGRTSTLSFSRPKQD